jgi:hypothetical protein
VPFELIAFTTDPVRAKNVLAAGAAAVLVDWENQGKYQRQAGADTQINTDTWEDLVRLRRAVSGPVICRLNGFHPGTQDELESAIVGGADEILLPMVRHSADVERVLEWANGRCHVGILIETMAAVAQAEQLGRLPLRRVYVGLNDLAIDRGSSDIFTSVADGTLDAMRPHILVPFGFGGLTLPDRGYPIPSPLLLGEIVRLRSSFTFLRRSFWRDTAGQALDEAVARMLSAVRNAEARTSEQIAHDRSCFADAIAKSRWSAA